MQQIAIIGGSGFDQLPEFVLRDKRNLDTPYGSPSSDILFGELFHHPLIFLPRHGKAHNHPPHRINYRANIWALKECGVSDIIAFAAVGGIARECESGKLVLPDQLIDYTWGREHTFYDGEDNVVEHIDFGEPYCPKLRSALIQAADKASVPVLTSGTYGVTQGPRLETPAEIDRMEKDGCDIVGMTGMPEAALAREADINYACLGLVVNAAAGRSDEPITMELILENLEKASGTALALVEALVKAESSQET